MNANSPIHACNRANWSKSDQYADRAKLNNLSIELTEKPTKAQLKVLEMMYNDGLSLIRDTVYYDYHLSNGDRVNAKTAENIINRGFVHLCEQLTMSASYKDTHRLNHSLIIEFVKAEIEQAKANA